MSFLDDSSATLQEALAFIDANETSESSGGSSPLQCKPGKIGYWKRLKAENDRLRDQATQLEKTLTHLQASTSLTGDHRTNQSVSAIQVERELQRRLQAESTNQELKSLIARNLKVIETLSTLSVQAPDNLSPVLSALVNRANGLKCRAVEILSRVGLLEAESFLHRTQREIDPQLGGAVVETTSSVPLTITKHEADDSLWQRFTGDAEVYSANPYAKLAVGGFAKSVSSTFAFDGERFKLSTHMLLRRHIEAGIAVYIWTASSFLPNSGMEFVEEALITTRDTKPLEDKRPALFQYWYRIYAQEGALTQESSPSIDLELLSESAMRLRGHMSMRYLQSLEFSLMSGTSSGLPSCEGQNLI